MLKKINIKIVISFLIIVLISGILLISIDSGIFQYFEVMNYIKSEGVAISVLIAVKFIFMGAITFLFMGENLFIKIFSYVVCFFSMWLSELNLIINKGPLNESVIKVAIGDSSTRVYITDTITLFYIEILKSGGIALVIIIFISMINWRFLPKIATWKSVLPIFILCIGYFGTRGSGYLVNEMPIPVKMLGMTYGALIKNLYYGPRDNVAFNVKVEGMERIVYIIDESVRGDLLSINGFEKKTTPFLNQIIDNHFNYGITSSAANCSAPSNILLQTGITDAQVPDINSVILKTPSIFQYAKNAGYKTFYIPVRGTPGEYSDFMTKYDFEAIDHAVYIKHNHPNGLRTESDFKLQEEITKILNKYPNEKIFIYALKEGNHFLYKEAYPRSEAHFPDNSEDELADLRNGYYNALTWVVDNFFNKLLSSLKNIDATIVYTSDHGQGLREEEDHSTHCKPTMPLQVQGNVPLILFATKGDKIKLQNLVGNTIKNNLNQASHFNLFPSLLVMMGYDQLELNTKYPKTIFQDLKGQSRIFVSGDLWSKVYKTSFIIEK